MIHLIESASSAERMAAAHAFLAGLPPDAEVLVVGASRDAADDLVRRVTAARGATFGLHRASLLQLAARLAAPELARRGLTPATTLGAEALAARVTFEAAAHGSLAYFEPVARFPGFAGALATSGAAADIGRLLGRFEAALRTGRLADRALLLDLATDAASQDDSPPIVRLPLVLFDVPIASTAERAFIRALLASAPSALITVAADDARTLDALEALGVRAQAKAPPPRPAPLPPGMPTEPDVPPHEQPAGSASALAHLRTYLFADAAPPSPAGPGEAVFFSAPGEGREAVEIARRLLEEARDGTPFDQMAILLRAPHTYASLLETALARAGIPAFFARGARRPDPSGRALLVLLDCALEKLSARRFAEYLSLGQVPRLDASGAPPTAGEMWIAPEEDALILGADAPAEPEDDAEPESLPDAAPATGVASRSASRRAESPTGGSSTGAVPGARAATRSEDSDVTPAAAGDLRAPWRWEQLLVESAVIGSRERWQRRLAGLAVEMRLRMEELRREDPDSPRVAGIERDLANLGHLERFALPVVGRLAALPAQATWAEWTSQLEHLAPMVLRRPERVLAVLADLRVLGPVGPVTLDEVRDVLADRLATVGERPPASRYGRVFVGALDQARGRTFEVVCIPGLAERVFPQKVREDPLLLDALRAELDATLTTQSDRAHHERLLLRIGVGAATRRAYLSYSRIEMAEARPRVPSFYAMEIQRALVGAIPDPQTLERDAARVGEARLAWPAPDDPARAIDLVEHDLATLDAVLRLDGAAARGRARYLIELNDRLARSLRSRWARWRPRFTPYDGIVQLGDGTRDLLGRSRPNARAYSVSALQRFAACPYQFYLSAICRLAPREAIAPIVRLDPLTRGSLFHEVQAEFLRALQLAGRLPVTRDTLAAAYDVLDATLARVAAQYQEQLAPAVDRVWRDEVASLGIDLRTWLDRSVEGQAEWEPFAFELAFGLPAGPGNDARSIREEVTLEGGWRLRGIIDLIERRKSSLALRVTDHKTGVNRTAAGLVVGKGEALQPVLYGLAVEKIFDQPVRESRLAYCTRAGEFSERVVPMTEEARRRGLAVIDLIDRAIARGFLPPAPRPRACSMCDFRPVCGSMEEQRVARKDQSALDELSKVRELR